MDTRDMPSFVLVDVHHQMRKYKQSVRPHVKNDMDMIMVLKFLK